MTNKSLQINLLSLPTLLPAGFLLKSNLVFLYMLSYITINYNHTAILLFVQLWFLKLNSLPFVAYLAVLAPSTLALSIKFNESTFLHQVRYCCRLYCVDIHCSYFQSFFDIIVILSHLKKDEGSIKLGTEKFSHQTF